MSEPKIRQKQKQFSLMREMVATDTVKFNMDIDADRPPSFVFECSDKGSVADMKLQKER